MRHGYHFEWLTDGTIYSRKYYQDDLEDFGRFSDEGISTSGSMATRLQNGKVRQKISISNLPGSQTGWTRSYS